jgi:hypothetical protein
MRGVQGPATRGELRISGHISAQHQAKPQISGLSQLSEPKNVLSQVKRSYGWNGTHLTGLNGARTWCGHCVSTHNLVKISTLAA